MSDSRPNPDALLARVRDEESAARRGRLKIFFGYAAGVGKTYAMLEAARREKAANVDVVVGYVEPHGRVETEQLLEGLEILPTLHVPYRGVTLREFDLAAALRRKPALILVDELAHSNPPGLLHSKRWQDVEELLDAGIDVYTTLNVQHVESLNDVIAQITNVVVRETLPDTVLERTDEIELIDLTPEELTERLQAGKVYVSEQARQALSHFFRKENLSALRELALRQTAQRLGRDVERARRAQAATMPWATSERLLVCVGSSPTSARVLRAAKRMAAALGAEWVAVAVERPRPAAANAAFREQVARHFRLAEQLGAQTEMLVGDDVAGTIVAHARDRNVTKIVVGKTGRSRWDRLLRPGLVEDLLDRSGDIDVYVVRGEGEAPRASRPPEGRGELDLRPYLPTALIVAVCGALSWALNLAGLSESNLVMVFLLGVALVATRYGRGPAIAAAIANVLVFDFFFVPPYLTFTVADVQYLFTFAALLTVGLLISSLMVRVRDQLQSSLRQNRHTAALFRLTRQLSEVAGSEFLVQTAGQQLRELFGPEVAVYVSEGSGPPQVRFGQETALARDPANAAVAAWVADHGEPAGAGTDTLPSAPGTFVPLTGTQRAVGALGVAAASAEALDIGSRRLLETCGSLIALSLERDQSVLQAHQAQLRMQAEQLRNSLLSSVSHDLRTPLAAIAGASSSLRTAPPNDPAVQEELLSTIEEESQRLARLVDNLLDMTRLESGQVRLNLQWQVLEELIGSALHRTFRSLTDHKVTVALPADLPLLLLDGVLAEQVFVNLFENAARYTPPGSSVWITARRLGEAVELMVADNGPGLPPGAEAQVFEKFFRGTAAPDGRRGVGLGLAICRGIVEAHGGSILGRNRAGGGAEFVIHFPIPAQGPSLPAAESAPARALP